MESDKDKMEYKYGYRIGKYIANCESVVWMFKKIFNKEYKLECRKINWLSKYEIDLLYEDLLECVIKINKNNTNEEKDNIDLLKKNIIYFLR